MTDPVSTPPTGPGAQSRATGPSRRLVLIGAGVVAALAILGAGAWYLLFGGEPPSAVDIDTAAGAAGASPAASTPASTPAGPEPTSSAPDGPASGAPSSGPGAGGGVDGTWTIDRSIGSFDDFTSSWVGFRVAEELGQGIGSVEAVGRTPAVSGSIQLAGATLGGATIEADLTRIVSDRPRRDGAIQRSLDTSTFPTASFVLTQPLEFGSVPATGETVSGTAVGELTIHGVTRGVEVPLEARLVDDTIVVVGSAAIAFSDYGVSMPSAPIVVSVEDNGTIELQLFFRRSG